MIFPVAGYSKFDRPKDAAEHFAEDYITFTDPRIGAFQQGDSRSGEVPVRPTRRGPVTTVLVRKMSDQRWYVIGATTPQIEIARPKAGSRITSPVRVTGRASAFEGNVLVQVRRGTAGRVLGQAPVTGRGDGVLGPYSGSVRFTNPGSGRGAMVYLIDSPKDGSIWQAAAIPIGFTR